MQLPFSAEQFYGVFRAYNVSVWPLQWLLTALAVLAVGAIALRRPGADRFAAAVLAVLWLWTGIAYHLAFFSAINPLAYGFAAIAIGGGLAFAWHGVVRRRLAFRFGPTMRCIGGGLLIAYALVVYPAWSIASGHRYPELPSFGLPCPTTLFTLGLLALATPPYPRSVLVAPVLWSLIGAQAAFLLDVTPDLALLVAAAVGIALFIRNGKHHDHAHRAGIAGVR